MRTRTGRLAVAAVAVLALATGSAGHAGTAADPEIIDASGDVQWIPDGDLSYLDLQAAWFGSLRGTDGSLNALRLTIRNAAAPAEDQAMALIAFWKVAGSGCSAELNIWDHSWSLEAGGFKAETTADAWLYSWCEGDEGAVTLGPVNVRLLQEGKRASYVRDGVDYIATIPLALFEGTSADGLYREGAVLTETIVNTMKVLPTSAAIGVDWNDAGARDYVLGS